MDTYASVTLSHRAAVAGGSVLLTFEEGCPLEAKFRSDGGRFGSIAFTSEFVFQAKTHSSPKTSKITVLFFAFV
jgi:hypothetical protein